MIHIFDFNVCIIREEMIRLADYNDIEELTKLRILQQKEDWKDRYPNEDKEFTEITKMYLKENLNRDIYIFLEEFENKIVATCGLQIIKYMPQCLKSGIEGYICNVFTLEEYRRRGIQTKLLEECLKFAIDKSIIRFKLTTNNPEAISIYKNMGFEYDKSAMKIVYRNYEKI